MISPPLKYYGSDLNTAKKIISLFPPHEQYIEPFCGTMATMLAYLPSGRDEIAADIYPELINFWLCVKNPNTYRDLYEYAKCFHHDATNWGWAIATQNDGTYIERICKFMIRYNWSRNGLGKEFATSDRLRRGMPEYQSRWLTQCERILTCHRRLQSVDLYCLDAIELLNFYRYSTSTLFYLDPPFHPDTRQGKGYQHEQDALWHEKFLLTCLDSSAKIIISGNRCPIYDNFLKDWIRVDFTQINAAGGSKNHRIESFWCNYGKRTRF